MNEPGTTIATDSAQGNSSHSSLSSLTPGISDDSRIMELQLENSRLQRLIAELLLKNQQLRKKLG